MFIVQSFAAKIGQKNNVFVWDKAGLASEVKYIVPRTVDTPYLVFCMRLSIDCSNNNICKPHIKRNIMHAIKLCVVIFFPQSYSRSQTEVYDDKSAFCWGQ